MQPVFRFAPSPNGFLHLGHAYSALLNAEMARRLGGRFLVRIEDIDTSRCTDALVAACLDDLAWLGLQWERPALRQSAHFPRYRAVAAELEARGLVYPCFCTRRDIAGASGTTPARDPDGSPRYPGTCRRLSAAAVAARRAAGEPFALRLDMTKALDRLRGLPLAWRELSGDGCETTTLIAAEPEPWGDVVLVRKECPTSYHLSVVLDDAVQGVSHVVRGNDLYAATAIHRVLQELLSREGLADLAVPAYHHHALLQDRDGRKLAKSAASTPLRQFRAGGATPEDIRRRCGLAAPV